MTATNTSQSSSLGSVSFLNIFGVLVSVVLCVLFIILGGHALKYLKEFACKIKIIVNRADDKSINLKDYNQRHKETEKPKSEAQKELESIYENEIRKSRSLQYWMIVKNLVAKYDHIIYYPFRDKLLEQYDLLKPKTSFYTLLVICTCCVAWMTTIFLSAILQNVYSNISTVPLGTFIGLTVAIAIISAFLNIVATNRLFRIYLLTLKSAFRVDYGHEYKQVDAAMREFQPEDSDEEKEFYKYQYQDKYGEGAPAYEIIEEDLDKEENNDQNIDHNNINNNFELGINSQLLRSHNGLLQGEEQPLDSSRRLMGDEVDRSDKALLPHEGNSYDIGGVHGGGSMINKSQDIGGGGSQLGNGPNQDGSMIGLGVNNNSHLGLSAQHNASTSSKRKRRAIKDIFPMQVKIDGADEANEEAKYIYVEDKYAIGDLDLLENEALKGENQSNVMTFTVLFIIIACASGVCCYLNYSFSSLLAQYVFYMFVGGFLGDIIAARPIMLMIYALFRYCKAFKRGYRRVDYKKPADIKQAYNKAIKDMFDNRRKYREEQIKRRNDLPANKFGSTDSGMKGANNSNLFGTNPLAALMDKQGDRSQDIMMDNYQHLTQNAERHDTSGLKPPRDFNDDEEEQYAREIIHKHDDDADGNKLSLQTQVNRVNPTDFAKPQIEDDQKNFEKTQTMSQYHTSVPLISNLQKAIREKEEEKLNKLMDQKQLNNELVDYNLLLLRKIYDAYEERADKVLKNFRKDKRGVLRKRYMVPILNPNYDYERLLKEMQADKEEGEDQNEVKEDGLTVCEDFEHQLMDAINEECADQLYPPEKVERQRIDKFGNPIREPGETIDQAQCAPAFGEVEMECEDNQVEDDEHARRMQMLEDLRRRLANGEELTAEELALLEQLENERLKELEELIQGLLKKGLNNLTDEEKLTLILYQKEKCHILLDQEKRKKPRTDKNIERMQELEDEIKRLEIEELKLKMKLFGLSEEEQQRLWQLEQEQLEKMMKRIKELEHKGWDNLTNEEKFELLGLKKSCLNIELDRLNRKKPPLSEEDLLRIKEIEEELRRLELEELLLKQKLGLLTDAEKARLKQLQDFFANQERQEELDELERLRRKLLDGTITEEELRRLRELERKLGLDPIENPFEQQQQLNEEFDQNMQAEEDDEDILHSRITDQDNFQDLPPVEVMNNPHQSPQKLLQDENAEDGDGQAPNGEEQADFNNMTGAEDQDELNQREQLLQDENENQEQLVDEDGNPLGSPQKRLGEQAAEDAGDISGIEKMNQLDDSNIDPNLLAMAQQNQEDFNELQDSRRDDQKALEDELQDLLMKQQMGLLTPEEKERLMELERLLNQQQQERDLDREASDLKRLTDRQNLEDEMAFGREDLEQENAAALAADGESIYSHKTSAILDEEKVSFMHIDHLKNEDVNSEESFGENDMVYYEKDDMTLFSEGRGINRVKRRQAPPQYYSENDLQEVKEGDFSEGDSVSGRSGGRSRRTMGRGQLSHHQLETQSHEDLIEGRVKVDAWNLNYRKKKKKQKKRKVTDNAKRKMKDLQDIYGVDARTLANLKKGPLPRKQLAQKGKMNEDDDFNHSTGSRSNAFKTTGATFFQNQQATPGNRMQQSIADNQSNLFSFNGFGATRQNWGNGMRDSRLDSQYGKQTTGKKNYPLTGIKKMTDTQQKFMSKGGQLTGREGNIENFMDEESKSAYSGSRSRGASQNRFNGSSGMGSGYGGQGFGNIKNNKAGGKATKGTKGKKGAKGTKKKSTQPIFGMRASDGDDVDSHTESDEAVDDRGAMFQRRNNFGDYYNSSSPNGRGYGGMNDEMDHSESDEGNNQDIPRFQSNDQMFKQRGAVNSQPANGNQMMSSQMNSSLGGGNQNRGLGQSQLKGSQSVGMGGKMGWQSNASTANNNQNLQNKKPNHQKKPSNGGAQNMRNSGSVGRRTSQEELEDLEAQSVQYKTGKKGAKQSTQKKDRQDSAERMDSEEENDGGQVMFQKRNLRQEFNQDDIMRSGQKRGNQGNSGSKPPLSNRKRGGTADQDEDRELDDRLEVGDRERMGQSNSFLGASGAKKSGNKANAGQRGRAAGASKGAANRNGGSQVKGSGSKPRNAGFGGARSDASDNDQFRMTNYGNPLESDGEFMANQSRRRGGLESSFNGQATHSSLNNAQNNKKNTQRRRDRGARGGSDDEDEFIIGPESNHSSLKKRPLGGSQLGGGSTKGDLNDEHYLLMQRERQIVEEIESDREHDSSNVLAKKRKIRKAAKSTNVRDAQQLRYQELQKERLRKMKREAEGALFSKETDLEAGVVQKKKKKKEKKDMIKKEINYWLDYDSPYAEYLVARFREWSPNPNLVRNPSAGRKGPSQERTKYSEVANVYNGRNSQNSRSRERDGRKSSLNTSAAKLPRHIPGAGATQSSLGSNIPNQNPNYLNVNSVSGKASLIPPRNQLMVDDFEEP